MAKATIFVDYKGQKVCLNELSVMTGMNPSTLLWRHKKGKELLAPARFKKPEPTPEDLTTKQVAELRKLSRYSEGQSNHWEIMCDLAGLKRKHAKELKKVIDAKG